MLSVAFSSTNTFWFTLKFWKGQLVPGLPPLPAAAGGCLSVVFSDSIEPMELLKPCKLSFHRWLAFSVAARSVPFYRHFCCQTFSNCFPGLHVSRFAPTSMWHAQYFLRFDWITPQIESTQFTQDNWWIYSWRSKTECHGSSSYEDTFKASLWTIKGDLHGTTLSHTTSLRHELLRVNQTYNSLMTLVYVTKNVVGF